MRIVMTLSLLLVLLSSAPGAASGQEPESYPAGVTAFGLDLFQILRQEEGNLFFSPYSIHAALTMCLAGAGGETEQEMLASLRLSGLDPAGVHDAAANLRREIQGGTEEQGFALSVANSLWGQEGYAFLDPFLEVMDRAYGAGLEQVDFQGDSEGARQRINAWVEDQTNDRIKDLIPPGLLSADTRLVLANAVYFLGRWLSPFTAESTADLPFHPENGEEVPVPTMRQQLWAQYAQIDGVQALELDYEGGRISMVILLPDQGGLAALEQGLDSAALAEFLQGMTSKQVALWLPKWELSSDFTLAQALEALGMGAAFDAARADFSGMDGTRELYIGDVAHKAFVRVDEEGTEAAAATAPVMVGSAMPAEPPVQFQADHPFLYLIRDKVSGAILFLGRMADPRG